MTYDILLIGFLVMLLAGLVKGLIGMGLPTVGIGLLSLVMAPPEAAAIIVVPALVTNLWQYFAGPGPMACARRFGWMMALLVAGTLVGGLALGGLSSPLAVPLIGLVLVLYAFVGLFGVPMAVPPGWEGRLSPLMGFLTGIITGLTGVSVLPSAPYLKALDLDKDRFIEVLGLTFLVATLALAITLAAPGADGAPLTKGALILASVAALVPSFAGMEAGRRLRTIVSPATFTRLFFIGLGLLGAYMMARGLLHRS